MDNNDRTQLARKILLLIVAVILGAVIIWVLFIRKNSAEGDATNNKNPSVSQTEHNKLTTPATPNDNLKKNTNAPSSGKVVPSSSSSASPTELANAGPGNTIALFTVSAIVGTIGHALYQRKLLMKR